MKALQFILISAASMSILYGFYLVIYRKGFDFKELRVYLLASIFISVLLPLSNFRISIEIPGNIANEYGIAKNQATAEKSSYISEPAVKSASISKAVLSESSKNGLFEIIKKTYLIILLALLFRMLIHITVLFFQFFRGRREKSGRYVLIYNSRLKNSFSFFNWIFLSPDFSSGEETEQIILHEKIHASQYHSFDLILIELLAAAMWFNPLVWMMRKSIQLVHEYLADEGVLNTGIDKINYQALLINQVAEERLICLSSNFNYSQIKKRMIMMNSLKLAKKAGLKF
jgi:beta-lactamase regulating signal transducer with metallopeptidase domain